VPQFLSHSRVKIAFGAGLVWACLFAMPMRAAETTPSEAEPTVEIPAPVYVTLMLARDDAVHRELKLSPTQQTAVRAVVAKVDQPLWQLRDVPPQRCADKLAEQFATLNEGLDATLTPQQRERFDQIVMQTRGAKALVAPDVRERLSLSGDQQDSLRKIVAAASGGTLDSQKVLAVLEPEQQQKLSGMFGARFDLSQVAQVCCIAPEMRTAQAWINSPPLSLEKLRGKVVVVHFWAFGCINCIRNLPHYQGWFEAFPESDVTIIGIHTPETSAERELTNLQANVKERGIEYPVAFDAAAENWKAWGNNMWPSVYLVDRRGRVRWWWYGELNWQGAKGEETMRKRIQTLIDEK
jgi:thiol-disulfide isomerase/thioredoxin